MNDVLKIWGNPTVAKNHESPNLKVTRELVGGPIRMDFVHRSQILTIRRCFSPFRFCCLCTSRRQHPVLALPSLAAAACPDDITSWRYRVWRTGVSFPRWPVHIDSIIHISYIWIKKLYKNLKNLYIFFSSNFICV
jgi:hypothetical protein